jgi:cytochrome c oxidase subunit 2
MKMDMIKRLSLLAFPWLLIACGYDNRQSGVDPKSAAARMSDDLYNLTLWICVVMTVLVSGALFYALWKFRYQGESERPEQVHGHLLAEISWTIAPVLILIAIMVPTVQTIFAQQAEPPANALHVKVTAKQWWWEYEYKDRGVVVANELHIPAGRPIFLDMVSTDVIHAWWAPKLTGKRDVNSWQRTFINFDADEPGVYWGQCTEFCGDSHSLMRIKVIVDTPEDFEKWLDNQAADAVVQPSPEVRGALAQCFTCHTMRGVSAGIMRSPTSGPDLTHLASRDTLFADVRDFSKAHLKEWLRDPRAVKAGVRMPGSAKKYPSMAEDPVRGVPGGLQQLNLSDDLLDKVVDYLATLK